VLENNKSNEGSLIFGF